MVAQRGEAIIQNQPRFNMFVLTSHHGVIVDQSGLT